MVPKVTDVAPAKYLPVMVTVVPPKAGPWAGEMEVISGFAPEVLPPSSGVVLTVDPPETCLVPAMTPLTPAAAVTSVSAVVTTTLFALAVTVSTRPSPLMAVPSPFTMIFATVPEISSAAFSRLWSVRRRWTRNPQ